MISDIKVPPLLKRELQWFASIIGRPIDEDSRMNPISPSNQAIELEAAEHVVPSPTLRPAQRIQIYNQQYWWRLLNALHEAFPMLTRLFGFYDFNRIVGIPYLVKYPPRHWSLPLLGERLPLWAREEYKSADKALVWRAAQVDWAFTHSSLTGQLLPLKKELFTTEAVLSRPLYVQPHLHLFEMEYNIFDFRSQLLEHTPEYWMEHDIPQLEQGKTRFFVLYRNQKNEVSWKEISSGEFHLLSFFQKGTSVEQACQWLEQQDTGLQETSMESLSAWFQEWTARGWLSFGALITSTCSDEVTPNPSEKPEQA